MSSARFTLAPLRRLLQTGASIYLLGGIAAGVLFASSNILSSRFFRRWDVTEDALYTLSPATTEVLARLDAPVEVIVLLGRNDGLTTSVRYLLDAYRGQSGFVTPRFVDPDRNPAEFIAIQREYGLLEGKTEDGRLASDASIIVAQAGRRWFITTDDIVAFDDETGAAKPRLEQVLTEGLAQLRAPQSTRVCITRGHGELGWQSVGPQGLAEFRSRLERNNFEIREVELGKLDVGNALAACDVALVFGPTRPLAAPAARELNRAIDDGMSAVLALGPIVDDEGRVLDPGLGDVLTARGIRVSADVVFERDSALRMPVGIGGEVFLATPHTHAVTLGMLHGDQVELRALMQLTQSFTILPQGTATPLLVSSPASVAIDDFRIVQRGALQDLRELREAEYVVAAAVDAPKGNDKHTSRRLVLIGTPSVFWSSTWTEPALLGTRRFAESVMGWVAARPPLVSVPEKASHPAGVSLTEEALDEVKRYVLLYMPLCAALVGVLLLMRRRHEVQSASREPEGGAK